MIGPQKWPASGPTSSTQAPAAVTQATPTTTIVHSFRPPIFSIFGTHRPPTGGGLSFLKPQRPTRPSVFRPPVVIHRPISVFQPFGSRPTAAPVFQGPPPSQQQQQQPSLGQSATASPQTANQAASSPSPSTTIRPAPVKPHHPSSSSASQQPGSLASGSISAPAIAASTQRPPVPTLKNGLFAPDTHSQADGD